MVKLTQIDDESNAQNAGSYKDAKKEAYETDSSDSEVDEDDDFDIENETFYDRIVALKDIIAPEKRSSFLNAASTARSYANTALTKTGSLAWTLASSALLLAVPLSLAILAESQIQEMEKEILLQQSAQDVLAPGSEAAFDEKKIKA